jgi:hypothetical protein
MAAKEDLNEVSLFDFFIYHYTIYSLIEMTKFISDKSKILSYGIILFLFFLYKMYILVGKQQTYDNITGFFLWCDTSWILFLPDGTFRKL